MRTKRSKPVDYVAYEPVLIEVHKARALTSVLEQLGETAVNNLVYALEDGSHPEDTREWLHSVVADALRAALDEIDREYRNARAPEGPHVVGLPLRGREAWLRQQIDGLDHGGES